MTKMIFISELIDLVFESSYFYIYIMAGDKSCQNCTNQLQPLRQRHQSLIQDYRILTQKNQMLRNTQAAYEFRNEELSRTCMKHQVQIKLLECNIQQMRACSRDSSGSPSADLFESEVFRRDVNRNQELNHIIDLKNKDLIFMKEQMKEVNFLKLENKQLRERITFLSQNYQKVRLNQSPRARINNDQIVPYMLTQSQVPPRSQHPAQQILINAPVQQKRVEGPSVLHSLKVCSSSTQGSTKQPRQSASRYESSRGGQWKKCEHGHILPCQDRSRQLKLIQSKIQQLQQQNDSLRDTLTSKIY